MTVSKFALLQVATERRPEVVAMYLNHTSLVIDEHAGALSVVAVMLEKEVVPLPICWASMQSSLLGGFAPGPVRTKVPEPSTEPGNLPIWMVYTCPAFTGKVRKLCS